MGKAIAIAARKGGVGKTMTAVSLGLGLARQGYKTLIIDTDSQHSATVSLGVKEPDRLAATLTNVMYGIMNETDFDPLAGIIRHTEGADLMPANSTLTGVELALASQIDRESVLRQYVETVKPQYDWIIIDTSPSLDLMTVNALAAANSVIIPVAPKFLDAKGLELLLKNVAKLRKKINPALEIDGILLTMVDRRSKLTRDVIASIEGAYGGRIRIFSQCVPQSVRAAETSVQGVSIFEHEPRGKVAAAYGALIMEVLGAGVRDIA